MASLVVVIETVPDEVITPESVIAPSVDRVKPPLAVVVDMFSAPEVVNDEAAVPEFNCTAPVKALAWVNVIASLLVVTDTAPVEVITPVLVIAPLLLKVIPPLAVDAATA